MDNILNLHIAICEDLQDDAINLKNYIKKTGLKCDLAIFESSEKLLDSFFPGKYDIIFMDIYLNNTNTADGIEAVRTIRESDTNVLIAFTTSSCEHALDSYRLGAIKYIEKPVIFENIKEVLELSIAKKKNLPTLRFKIKGGGYADIHTDMIMYFEQKQHMIEIHLTDHILSTSQSVKMAEIEKSLSFPPFIRCHRSFIVNLNYVNKFDKKLNSFIMKNGDRVDMRRGGYTIYKDLLNEWRLNNIGGDDFEV